MPPESFQTLQSTIHRLLAEDRPKEAIDALFAALEEISDREWVKVAIQAAAQLKEVSRQFAILGIIDHKTYMDNKAEVTAKVLEVLDKMEVVVQSPSEQNLGNLLKVLAALVAVLSAIPGKKEPPKFSSFTDSRDGRIYKTVRLAGLTWLAENLDYDVGEGCWYYDDNPEYGKKYGRLYTWEAAKRACPPGWRLPEDEEWRVLAMAYGGLWDEGAKGDPKQSYHILLEGGSSGFSALLGGSRNTDGSFYGLRSDGYYWSATEGVSTGAWGYLFSTLKGELRRFHLKRAIGFSCRCVQGAPFSGID